MLPAYISTNDIIGIIVAIVIVSISLAVVFYLLSKKGKPNDK